MSEPFVMVQKFLLRAPRLSLAAKNLLALLADYRNPQTGQCNPKVATLASELGLSAPTVKRALAELTRIRLVQIIRRQRASQYRIAPKAEWRKILIDQIDPSGTRSDGSKRSFLLGQIDPSDAPVSINELDLLNYKASSAAAADSLKGRQSTPRAKTAAAATNKISEKKPENELRELAHSLTAELLQTHPEKGLPNRAPRLLEQILRTSPDPEKAAETIRASHAGWRMVWAANPQRFVPQLWRWFADEDYQHPPTAPPRKEPERERRKSRVEEMLDAL